MPVIQLTDGSTRTYPQAVTAAQVAADISPRLLKQALAAQVDANLVDMSYLLQQDARLQIITTKDTAGLEVLRHSCAHLLAQAVVELFPGVEVTIGPVIENGFYYDFDYERPFTLDDLPVIERKMRQLVKQRQVIERHEYSRDDAIALFRRLGQEYKVQIIQSIPAGEVLTVYGQGGFLDLCRGPHIPNMQFLKAFKLTKVAGAYWRGDSNNRMLTRIYGTAWASQDDLDAYLERVAEAERRDHRVLAKKMQLFHMQDIAPGEIFWHPRGWTLYNIVRDYIRNLVLKSGYQEINTPIMVDKKLWVDSGHAEKFSDDMYLLAAKDHEFAIKPMSCPCHIQVYKQGLKSYRDLPLRLFEFGYCHRNEPSGSLHGMMRVRAFVQDDGHIFCTLEQVKSEVAAFMVQLFKLYADFGFTEIEVKLSTRPEKRVGDDAVWDRAEQILAETLQEGKIKYEVLPGEGAFYGPKLEFHLCDCLGRRWQCGTLQLDFFMPERLQANFIDEHGEKQVPVMLHRAIIGTLERFIGIVLEHYAGLLPLWLAPQQIMVVGVSVKQADYVKIITQELQKAGIRADYDLRNEKIGFKIRQHTIARVPYIVVVGEREVETQTLTLRSHNGEQQADLSLPALLELLQQEIKAR